MIEHSTKEASRHVDAVLKAIDILECFFDARELGLKEIVARSGFSRSRVMRLLGTLESRGYIVENKRTRRYSLGIKIFMLTKEYDFANFVEAVIRPELCRIVQTTGESATFQVREGDCRLVLAHEESPHPIRFSLNEGQRMPLLKGGAASKALMAFAPEREAAALIASCENDRDGLAGKLDGIREQGFAETFGEVSSGVHCIAFPVISKRRTLVGVLSVAGPGERFVDQRDEHFVAIQESAGRLSYMATI